MSNYATIQVLDFGKYHRDIIQLSLDKHYPDDQLDEVISIRYGTRREAQVCSAYYFLKKPGIIYLSAAMTGKLGDIKISVDEWLEALVRLRSRVQLEHWTNILNKKVYA